MSTSYPWRAELPFLQLLAKKSLEGAAAMNPGLTKSKLYKSFVLNKEGLDKTASHILSKLEGGYPLDADESEYAAAHADRLIKLASALDMQKAADTVNTLRALRKLLSGTAGMIERSGGRLLGKTTEAQAAAAKRRLSKNLKSSRNLYGPGKQRVYGLD